MTLTARTPSKPSALHWTASSMRLTYPTATPTGYATALRSSNGHARKVKSQPGPMLDWLRDDDVLNLKIDQLLSTTQRRGAATGATLTATAEPSELRSSP